MSACSMNGELSTLIGDVAGNGAVARSRQATGAHASPRAEVRAPSLRTVMSSSRVRAWIPPHLIESLQKRG